MKYPTKNRLYSVYHIRPIGETNTQHFYIGITKNSLATRLRQHMHSKRPVGDALRNIGVDNVEIVCLHKALLGEAMRLEYSYRPYRNMGWNILAGGESHTVVCKGCGKWLPKRRIGAMCMGCNDARFKAGSMPHNYGNGVKCMLVSPDGIEHIPYSLHQFCRDNDLVTANVRKVLRGERKHTKGWVARLIEG